MTVQDELLRKTREHHKELQELLKKVNEGLAYEDHMYRFYHQSFKVYLAQKLTLEIVAALRKLGPPDTPLSPFFEEIIKEGTGREFDMSQNREWVKNTRPIIEAFLHAKYFLEMLCKYGNKFDECPQMLDYGLAAVLELYEIR